MSVWRRKAIESFPELRDELQDPEFTPMMVMFELLPMVCNAHRDGNDALARKIYQYTEWCARQRPAILWNAAFVGFYEHLVDEAATRDVIWNWVPRDIFEECLSLFAWRMKDEPFADVVSTYNKKNNRHNATERSAYETYVKRKP